MLSWMKDRRKTSQVASKLYGSIVAKARDPAFYVDGGAADTLDGRYGVLCLVLWRVIERLGQGVEPAPPDLSRALVETFVTDMDDNMRELGVGDLSVPRKVKKAAAGLYDRMRAYQPLWAAGNDSALAELLVADLAASGGQERTAAIVSALRAVAEHLATLPDVAVSAGNISFPAIPSSSSPQGDRNDR
jgi:cytochrome b pre-mRNA-processing protein 3